MKTRKIFDIIIFCVVIMIAILSMIFIFFKSTPSTILSRVLNVNGDKLRICPDIQVDNQMPGISGIKGYPRQYFILNKGRREMTEFDLDWVNNNCKVKKEIAS